VLLRVSDNCQYTVWSVTITPRTTPPTHNTYCENPTPLTHITSCNCSPHTVHLTLTTDAPHPLLRTSHTTPHTPLPTQPLRISPSVLSSIITSELDVKAAMRAFRSCLQVRAVCTVLWCALMCCAVLCCGVLYCIVLCFSVLYCTVLYCTVLYCTVLYCAACMVLPRHVLFCDTM
jgi:hypothetical protein